MLQVLHELWDFVSLFRYTGCDRFMSCDENMLERTHQWKSQQQKLFFFCGAPCVTLCVCLFVCPYFLKLCAFEVYYLRMCMKEDNGLKHIKGDNYVCRNLLSSVIWLTVLVYFKPIWHFLVVLQKSFCMIVSVVLYFSKKMVGMWTCGDIFKTCYFVIREAPPQFWICGSLQVLIDISIFVQVFVYRNLVAKAAFR